MAVAPVLSEFLLEADCTTTDAVGDAVYITSDAVAGRIQVMKVDPTDTATAPSIGVIISKPSTTTCTVRSGGPLDGIYSGLTPNSLVWIDSAARLTTDPSDTEPGVGTTYNYQVMGYAVASDCVLINPQTPVIRKS